MTYLLCGGESKERLQLLLSLTKINSESLSNALVDHYVNGFSENECVIINDVTQSNFNRAVSRLNQVAETVEKIKEIDWQRFKSVK
ncbi:MAG: PapB/FocB family fimbrial expression transcriptional regulator [Vibrio sp.]